MPKPFLTYAQQIQKLKDKNLVIPIVAIYHFSEQLRELTIASQKQIR